MVLRLACLGTTANIAVLRLAAEESGVATVVAEVVVEHGTPPALAQAVPYDALCILDPAPALADLVHAHGTAGTSVLLAGSPTEDPTEFERLADAFGQSGAALVVSGRLRQGPVARALYATAAQRRVGAPVYLRYAAEAGDGTPLLWQAADAIDLALHVLGGPVDAYAVGSTAGSDQLIHLALTLRHHDGSVALLGLGSARQARGHASLLLLGDRGAVEANPVSSGVILRDGELYPSIRAVGDERVDDTAAWLTATVPLVTDEAALAAERARARRLVCVLATVRRSLTTGSVEPMVPANHAGGA
jgi:predicted dehydrogenase